jgi:hypothetical protein
MFAPVGPGRRRTGAFRQNEDHMTMTRSVLAALLVAAMLPAQAKEASAPKLPEYDTLVAEWTAAKKANEDAMKALMGHGRLQGGRCSKGQQEAEANCCNDRAPSTRRRSAARAIELADQYVGDASMRVLSYATCETSPANADTAKAIAERIEKNPEEREAR